LPDNPGWVVATETVEIFVEIARPLFAAAAREAWYTNQHVPL